MKLSLSPNSIYSSPRTAVRGLWPCAFAATALLLVGCGGSGEVKFVSLQPKEIDPPSTDVWSYPVQECYWWVDEAGDLNVALRCPRHNLLLGRYGRVDLDVSFVLDEPPAGSGRNYKIGQRETRTLFRSALQNLRLISTSGIAGITMRDDGTLRGSFRMWIQPRTEVELFSFFPNDSGALLCFGTFQAVKDEQKGKAIRTLCESGGWGRGSRPAPPATSQPTTTAPVASSPTTSPEHCARGGSNPHGLPHRILSPARLPVPPLARI